ncbi:MAG: C4-dicarboxylate ABC transporter, partial [Gammaproteobacteria bacterium]|nr:C4-dicarboxylate ABC transporter [Gammaproteobacteria bacterium]
YDGTLNVTLLICVVAKLVLALYMLSSALAAYDKYPLSKFQIAARLVISVLLVIKMPTVYTLGLVAAIVLLILHRLGQSPKKPLESVTT